MTKNFSAVPKMPDIANAKLANVLGDSALDRLRPRRDDGLMGQAEMLRKAADALPDYIKHPGAPTSWEPLKIQL